MDDLAGRRCAQALGLHVVGTIGLIARAKRAGILESAALTIAAVRNAGLYVSDLLVVEMLRELDEQ